MSKLARRKVCELPDFSPTNVDFWFKSVELILTAASCSDDEMHDCLKNYLLDNDMLTMVWYPNVEEPVIEEIPEFPPGRKYVGLKKHFLAHADEDYEGLENVIKNSAIFGCRDMKPSAFLEIMNFVFRGYVPKCIKRTYWMARLPMKVQKVLLVTILLDPRPLEDRTLEDLAAVADSIAAYEKYHSLPKTNKRRIRLPEYIARDPEVWFYSLDEAFSANGIWDDRLKFEYTMDILRSEELMMAALFLTDLPNQPRKNKYANLKERIIKTRDVIKNDDVYSFVFRVTMLTPYPLLELLNDMAVKSNRVIPQLLIRTFWIMLLPMKTQAILFQQWTTSRETLQDLDIEALALVADSYAGTDGRLSAVVGNLSAAELDNKEVDIKAFKVELQSATTFQQKITLGMKYCDFMYRTYYKNNPSESIQDCITFHPPSERSEYTARDYYFDGCDCWYHTRFGEASFKCEEMLDMFYI